ncbi:MAG: hypothetical protein NUW08_01300, partial [Candidatus Uhrbacteria bacterium]|nr:hypothetical protein [Candidatus Uhrbacteria bacterium]
MSVERVTDGDWTRRFADDPHAHLISLPPGRSYFGSWTYQFGESFADWPSSATVHNMECGPACVSIIERLSGLDGTNCTYQDSVTGCGDFPNVHSMCRARGVCGDVTGFRTSSWSGNNTGTMRAVLEGLGYEVQTFPGTTASHLSLDAIRRAIDEDNPVIAAVDVRRYTASLGRSSDIPSHYIVVYGYTTDYHGHDGDVAGYVYALDPGYLNGQRLRITFEEFNAAINSDATGTTEPSGLVVTRPGFLRLPNSTWYPPGTLLRIDGEYYYVGRPDPSGAVVGSLDTGSLLRIWHASPEALRAQRVPTDRAITVSFNIVGCFQFMGEMNTARHFREYREPGGAIYLVDTNTRERMVFLNEDAYHSHNGSDEWMSTTEAERREWSGYRLSGDLGLSPGTFVRSPGSSTVWVVSVNGSGRVRLPIFNARTADIFGYPIDRLEE